MAPSLALLRQDENAAARDNAGPEAGDIELAHVAHMRPRDWSPPPESHWLGLVLGADCDDGITFVQYARIAAEATARGKQLHLALLNRLPAPPVLRANDPPPAPAPPRVIDRGPPARPVPH